MKRIILGSMVGLVLVMGCFEAVEAAKKSAAPKAECSLKERCKKFDAWMKSPRRQHTDSSYIQNSSSKSVK